MQGVTGCISRTVWDFTCCSNKNSLSDFCTCNYVRFFLLLFFFVAGKYRIGTVCTAVENMCGPRALQMKSPAGELPYERGGDARRLL